MTSLRWHVKFFTIVMLGHSCILWITNFIKRRFYEKGGTYHRRNVVPLKNGGIVAFFYCQIFSARTFECNMKFYNMALGFSGMRNIAYIFRPRSIRSCEPPNLSSRRILAHDGH